MNLLTHTLIGLGLIAAGLSLLASLRPRLISGPVPLLSAEQSAQPQQPPQTAAERAARSVC